MKRLVSFFTMLFVLLSASSSSAFACPRVLDLIDYNCNQELKIAITGDSIVYGTGDDAEGSAGYVARLQEKLPDAKITNLGVRGITSYRLLRAFKKLLLKPGTGRTKIKTEDADILIVDVGRNDYWGHANAALTVRNIRRLVAFLKEHVGADLQSSPFIIVSTLLPTSREFQQPFIDEVNALLLKARSSKFRVAIRFDRVPLELLSEDGLHPSAEGYDAMAGQIFNYISGPLQKLLVGHARDKDKDGIADFFELKRYGTQRYIADTDGDGFSDGAEVFTYLTNPLDPASFPIP